MGVLQGMADTDTGEKYVGYFLPSQDTVRKRKAEDDAPGTSSEVCVGGCGCLSVYLFCRARRVSGALHTCLRHKDTRAHAQMRSLPRTYAFGARLRNGVSF